MTQIEILYFESCPGWRGAVTRVREVLHDLGLDGAAAVRLISIGTEDDARVLRFLGSPSVRIDGRDVEPGSEERASYGLRCRLYADAGRLEGVPPRSLIRAALTEPRLLEPTLDEADHAGEM